MPRDGRVVRDGLHRAAIELFEANGYDGTTTGQIAARAGVTERTYFRHFPDKREVLFTSEQELFDLTVTAIAAVPANVDPLPALRMAFQGVVPLVERNRERAQRLAPIILAAPALVERELGKTRALTTLVAEALERRGVDERSSVLCARVGMAAFSTAIRRWSAMPPASDLHAQVDEIFSELRVMVDTLGR
jgi:AcrR family transcriptional regulator